MNKLICSECAAEYSFGDVVWRCECGGLLDIGFDVEFDLGKIERRKPTMWRYREAIPIESDEDIVSFEEGFTPLLEVSVGGRGVYIKQEQLFPTGSYKDRGASVLISRVKALGIGRVVEDSSGNAGAAVAAYCASAGIACDIYVPGATSPGKLAQVEMYGAGLFKIPGCRECTAEAVMAAAGDDYYASHSWNPFFFHGTKTFAFEVCEQLGWRAPDRVILPVGNGTLLLGAYIGFNELLRAGIIDKTPKITGVQAAHCAPLCGAFKDGLHDIGPIKKKETLAEGIAIAAPVRGKQILKAIEESKGDMVAINEAEIISALIEMGRKGFYIEPTSAVTVAGVKRYLEQNNPPEDEIIVSVFTGHGLKSPMK